MSRSSSPAEKSVDSSDTSPLVLSEISAPSGSYGGVDSPVFDNQETKVTVEYLLPRGTATTTGSGMARKNDTSLSLEPDDKRADTGKRKEDPDDDLIRAKYQSTYQREPDAEATHAVLASRSNPIKYLDTIREMPWSIRQKLSESKRVRTELGKEYFKERRKRDLPKQTFKKGKASWEGSFGLFDNSIKKIQAYFGSGVASYFTFLSRLLWMDVAIALICIGFICIPQIVLQEGTILDLTQNGLGVLQNSLVFYGYYEPTSRFDHYEMPLAYFITVVVVIAVSVITIVVWMSVSYRKSKISGTEQEYAYGWRMFSSWDFCIASAEGTCDRQLAIRTDFQETIWEFKISLEKSFSKRCCLYTIRLFTNVFVLALLGGSGYAIYYIAQFPFSGEKLGDFQELFQQYQLSLSVAGLKMIMPKVLDFIAYLEDWTPRMEINITLGRTVFFYFASLLVFILSLFKTYERETSNNGCGNVTSLELSTTTGPEETSSSPLAECWETEIGQEIFKLLLLDFALGLAILFVFDILRALLVKSKVCGTKIPYKSFDVTGGVLDIVYNQGLIWLGAYFSPLIPLFGVVKNVLEYAVRYFAARHANVPPKQLYRASRSGNFNMALLLLSLFVCIYPLMVVFFELQPSRDCGPFRLYCYVYEVLTEEIGDLPDWLAMVIEFVSSPEVIVPVLVLLVLVVIYYKTKSSSYKRVIKDLRDHLKFERHDVRRMVFHVARKTDGTPKRGDAASLPENS